MSMTDQRVLRTMRAQAWERAKGELMAVLQTYFAGEDIDDVESPFRLMEKATNEFIRDVEDNGLAE